jgi:hypothetical protein
VKKIILISGFVMVTSIQAFTQPSVSLNIGPIFGADGPDAYGLKNTWPSSGNTDSKPITFFSGGTGLLAKLGLMWEVSDHFAAGLIFQTIQWSLDENKRKSDMVSIGAEFRVNFSSSRNTVVPYFQGAFLFSNSNHLQQDQATGIASQVQPAFSVNQSTSVGFGADVGVEFKLTKALGLQIAGGLHGTEALKDNEFVKALNYGSGVEQPQSIDGVFFYVFNGGIKYYMGRGGKKRDF